MKTKFGLLAAAAMIVAAPIAFAQTTTTPSTGSTSTMGTSGTSTTAMKPTDVQKKLQGEGYSNISLKDDTSKGGWSGTAMKGGKNVDIHVDPSGKVTEK